MRGSPADKYPPEHRSARVGPSACSLRGRDTFSLPHRSALPTAVIRTNLRGGKAVLSFFGVRPDIARRVHIHSVATAALRQPPTVSLRPHLPLLSSSAGLGFSRSDQYISRTPRPGLQFRVASPVLLRADAVRLPSTRWLLPASIKHPSRATPADVRLPSHASSHAQEPPCVSQREIRHRGRLQPRHTRSSRSRAIRTVPRGNMADRGSAQRRQRGTSGALCPNRQQLARQRRSAGSFQTMGKKIGILPPRTHATRRQLWRLPGGAFGAENEESSRRRRGGEGTPPVRPASGSRGRLRPHYRRLPQRHQRPPRDQKDVRNGKLSCHDR